MRNQRLPLLPSEQAQVRRLVQFLGEAATAAALGIGVKSVPRVADGLHLNMKTREAIRASGWVLPSPDMHKATP